MATARRAVDLARTLRGGAGIRVRQPLARLWIALPGGDLGERDALLALVRDEVNVRSVELIGDESDLVDRRVKPLLPKIGKRLGSAIPAVMAAARDGAVEFHADGSVTLGGVTLAADEVEVLATPRPGTAVAGDEGLVVVIDTELTPELLAEGDARELQRAIQDLRKDAGLALDDRIEVWLDADAAAAGPSRTARGLARGRGPGGPDPARRRARTARVRSRPDCDRPGSTSRSVASTSASPGSARVGREDDRPADLAALPRDRGRSRGRRPAGQGVADVVPVAGRVRRRHRRVPPARPRPEQRRAVRVVPRERDPVRDRVDRGDRPDRRVPRSIGAVGLPVGDARPVARWRDRQPDRSVPARLRRRLRRHGHRHASASTRSTSPTWRSACRCCS